MEHTACPSCGYIKKPGEFGAEGECSKCGASLLLKAKKTPADILQKRKESNRKRAASKTAIRVNNKEIKTMFIAAIALAILTLGLYLFNPPQKTIIDEQANTQQAQEITAYMKEQFAQPGYTASWYNEIDDIQINQTKKQRTIEIFTTLDQRSDPTGNNICNAVSNYWQNHKNSFTGLRVIGMGGKITNYRYSLGSRCN
ncbi:MAG: hypothetical protein COB22_06020 [Cycloclasticus sp.]|nr:MAG: hypothetical protein COB22_06020 [Cycloclasticus sp.]